MVKGELQQAVIEGGHHLASWAMARHHILVKEDRLGRKSASLWSSLMPSAWKSSFPDHRAFNSKSIKYDSTFSKQTTSICHEALFIA
jgi:hypothetical protein